jgi:hypothetical protein
VLKTAVLAKIVLALMLLIASVFATMDEKFVLA